MLLKLGGGGQEEVLEPKFSKYSHGFRPSRGCHSALAQIRNWKGVYWLLEGDIKSFFDNIDHNIIAELLKRNFNEQKEGLLNVYWKLVKAGYIEWDNKKRMFIEPLSGVPQGGIVSPLLSNLILHEFDKYLEKLISDREAENEKIKKDSLNPAYSSLTKKMNAIRQEMGLLPPDELNSLKKKFRKILRERNRLKKRLPNPLWIKLGYVRYADDWLVGVWGPISFVKKLKQDLKEFLYKLKLELSEEKTLITNIRKTTAKFLGVLIGTSYLEDSRRNITVSGLKRRIGGMNVVMNAPIKSLLNKLESKGFISINNNKFISNPIRSFTPLSTVQLILRYRSILNGYKQYYSFTDNIGKLKYIYVFLKNSLERTIRLKEDLTKHEFLMTYGKNVKINLTKSDGTRITLDFACPTLKVSPKNFLFKNIKDPLLAKIWKVSSIHPLDQPCVSPPSRGGN